MQIIRTSGEEVLESEGIHLSVVIPVFNEEQVVLEMLRALDSLFLPLERTRIEILIVDDGSNDSTCQIVKLFEPLNFKLRLIRMLGNQGHMMALTAGLEAAKGTWIASMDVDFQDPPEVLLKMYKVALSGNCDVVQGVRRSRDGDSFFKRFTAASFYKILNHLTPGKTIPEAADFRIIHKDVRDVLCKLPERIRIYRFLIPELNFNIELVEFDRGPRAAGVTKYPLKKMVSLALESVFGFSAKPLHLLFVSGSLASLLFLVASVVVLILKIFINVQSGWTSLVLLILATNSFMIASLGLVGEYVGRIYSQVLNRPFAKWEE